MWLYSLGSVRSFRPRGRAFSYYTAGFKYYKTISKAKTFRLFARKYLQLIASKATGRSDVAGLALALRATRLQHAITLPNALKQRLAVETLQVWAPLSFQVLIMHCHNASNSLYTYFHVISSLCMPNCIY